MKSFSDVLPTVFGMIAVASYNAAAEAHSGASLGKVICRSRVLAEDGWWGHTVVVKSDLAPERSKKSGIDLFIGILFGTVVSSLIIVISLIL